jgi:hypothetical protein
MKTILQTILEALLNPKPNDFEKRNPADNYQYGPGLVLIPVPVRPNPEVQRQQDFYGR